MLCSVSEEASSEEAEELLEEEVGGGERLEEWEGGICREGVEETAARSAMRLETMVLRE